MHTLVILTGAHSRTALGRPTCELNKEYASALRMAGALPALAVHPDCAKEYADMAQGLVLTGGKDLSPALYGEQDPHPAAVVDPARDDMELSILHAFLEAGKPVLGICRGFQLINVYFGGSLWQHLPEVVEETHTGGAAHDLRIAPDSVLSGLYGTRIRVNSYHHQGIRTLGRQLKATAFADSQSGVSLIEAFEHESRGVLAVQWHPERSISAKDGTADMLPLLAWFAGRCSRPV